MTTTAPSAVVEIDFTTDLASSLAYYERVLSDGPLVWHRLQETSGTAMADSSGNAIGGTIAGSYTLNLTSGKPVSGETASRYIDWNSNTRISFNAGEWDGPQASWEAFIYRSSLDGNAATKYYIFTDTGPNMEWYVQGDGRIRMDKNIVQYRTTNVVVSAATWYHVVLTLDGPNDTVAMYVNGVAQAVTRLDPFENGYLFQYTINDPWYWGPVASLGVGAAPVSRIAEPAFYDYALQPSQVLDHYNARTVAPFAGYTWTDVTDYVLKNPGVGRTFGRQGGTEDFAPSSLEYTLVNDDRRFEFGNPSSPYSNVEPGRPTRIRMTQDAVTYDWAFGFIEDFPQEWDPSGQFGRVRIVAHDYLERMNNHDLGSRMFREQASGARMHVLANITGVPTASRDIGTGDLSVMAQTVEGQTAGDHAKRVARTDRGFVYFDGRGYLVFQDGDYRTTNSRSTSTRGTLGPSGSADIQTLGAPEFHAPMALVKNEITIRRPGGVAQTAVDATSKSKRGPRSYSDELLLVDDAAAATRAAALLADFKDPQLRVRAITFNPARTPGQWDHALGVKPSDRYTWRFEPQQGSAIVRDVFVEGVEDRWVGAEYRATWFLSLA